MLIVEKASLSGAPEVEGAAKGLLAAAVVPKVPALPNKALPKPVSEAAGPAPIYERSRVEPHCDREDGKQGKARTYSERIHLCSFLLPLLFFCESLGLCFGLRSFLSCICSVYFVSR
jgi:hypothetical protein